MDYNNKNIINHSSKNKSNLIWLNNSIDPVENRLKNYGRFLGKTNFNYKNYINNTININNSNNNNFYFNQSESDIDKKYNFRNSANNSYMSFYNKKKFEIQKNYKNKNQNQIKSSFNLYSNKNN